MKVVFVRHKIAPDKPEILGRLWSERLIALHFEDKKSTDPKDYKKPSAQRAFSILNDCCDSGAIVGADFSRLHPKMLVGEIEPGSEIKFYDFIDEGREFVYKVVKLKNEKEASYERYLLLQAIQPIRVAIRNWKNAKPYLEAILWNRKVPWHVNSLAPSQLEVMCYEFLRSEKVPKDIRLDFLLMPIGRTLKDVDIVGVSVYGQKIFAQVTHGTSKKREFLNKINKLEKYQSGNNILIFFGPQKFKVDKKSIEYISIENVFSRLTEDKSLSGYKMISNMLNW